MIAILITKIIDGGAASVGGVEELDVFKCIFEEYENTYHDEIWLKLRYIRKEYKNSLDTISSSLAAQYINKSDNLKSSVASNAIFNCPLAYGTTSKTIACPL